MTTLTSRQQAAVLSSLSSAAGTTPANNATEAGRWLDIALACEAIAGASSAATSNRLGYMRRAALALEAVEGTSPLSYNPSEAGYLWRIMNALEANAGVSSGSVGKRIQTAAAAYSASSAIQHTQQGARSEPAFETYTDTDVLENSTTYNFTLTISNYTSGAVRVGIATMLVGKRAIDNAAANGTFTGSLTTSTDAADRDFTWRAQAAGFIGTIDELKAEPA